MPWSGLLVLLPNSAMRVIAKWSERRWRQTSFLVSTTSVALCAYHLANQISELKSLLAPTPPSLLPTGPLCLNFRQGARHKAKKTRPSCLILFRLRICHLASRDFKALGSHWPGGRWQRKDRLSISGWRHVIYCLLLAAFITHLSEQWCVQSEWQGADKGSRNSRV